MRSFAAEAGGFYPAEGGDFGGDDAFVDADHAVFEAFGDAEDSADVAGVEVGGEAEFGVVGEGDGFGFGFEAEEGGDGAEGFFAEDEGVVGDVGEQGGLEEGAAALVAFAAGDDAGAAGQRIGDVFFDFGDGFGVDEGALGDSGFHAVADFEGFDGGLE